MTEPESHTLRLLRRIDQKVDMLDLKLSDLVDTVQRIEADLAATRGTVAALRHDVNVFSNRWADHEVRIRALESDDGT